jgi:hypothetical protein
VNVGLIGPVFEQSIAAALEEAGHIVTPLRRAKGLAVKLSPAKDDRFPRSRKMLGALLQANLQSELSHYDAFVVSGDVDVERIVAVAGTRPVIVLEHEPQAVNRGCDGRAIVLEEPASFGPAFKEQLAALLRY